MGVTVRSVLVKLKADNSDFNREALKSAATAKAIPDSLDSSAKRARITLSSLERELKKISDSRYDATVVLEDAEAAARLDALNARLGRFGTEVSNARVDVDDEQALAKISGIEAALLSLAHTTADPNIDLRGVAKAEAQMAALHAQLDSLKPEDVVAGPAFGGGGFRGLISGLDDSNDRMSSLIQYGVALGPALIPVLGGAAVGAAALGTSLTFAATGAGVAALALHGVGDALTALNKYQLDPTQTNLDALRLKLLTLAPAGQDFVFFLESLKPKLDQLKDTAQGGFLPGLQSGIEQVMRSFPQVNSLVGDLSTTLGGLADDAGHAFESPFWQGFLQTFSANASTELSKFARGIGEVTTGLAGMFQAFMPVGSDFTSELLDMSAAFSQWGQNLSTNQGFQDFVAYIETNGPRAEEALAAIAQAFISIVKAGAPVGSLVLPVITAMARALSAIADSPAGPVLIGLASGLAAVARAAALLKILNAPVLLGAIGAIGGPGLTVQTARLRLLAGGVGALALALSDLDDKAGLSNTGMGAALGFAVRGGWGAAIGGAIGLTKDLAAANDDLEKSMSNVDAAFASQAGNFLKNDRTALQQLIDQRAAYQKKLSGNGVSFWSVDPHDVGAQWDAAFTHVSDFFTNSSHESGQAVDDATARLADLRNGWVDFASAVGGDKGDISTIADTLHQLGYSAQFVADVMAKHNKTGLEGFTPQDSILWDTLVRQVKDFNEAADSVPGRAKAVSAAIAGLDNQIKPTVDSATALEQALNDLLDPGMNLGAALDAWTTSLRTLDQDLAKGSKTLVGNTNAAIKNRDAIRQRVSAFKATLVAEAQAGASSKELAAKMVTERGALINAADAAGLNRDQVRKLLVQYGLTPKLIATTMKLYGVDKAKSDLQDIAYWVRQIPSSKTVTIQTVISQGAGGHAVLGNAEGGWIRGAGSTTSDSIRYGPAGDRVSNLEYVVNAQSADANAALLEQINAAHGPVQWKADGGIGLHGSSGRSAGGTTTVIQQLPDRVTLRIGEQHFEAYVESIAAPVADDRIDNDGQHLERWKRDFR